MAEIDLSELLNREFYAVDFQAMLGDIQDFLDFSERSIEWQYKSELQRIEHQSRIGFLDEKYAEYEESHKQNLIENAEHRFSVSLPVRVRYAALVALVTAVEWQVKAIESRAIRKIPKKPKKGQDISCTVWNLRFFNQEAATKGTKAIDDFQHLTHVRNAVVHAAGIPRDYKHKDGLVSSVKKLKGFSIGKVHAWLGEVVVIDRGALAPYIESMATLIPKLWEAGSKRGLLQQ